MSRLASGRWRRDISRHWHRRLPARSGALPLPRRLASQASSRLRRLRGGGAARGLVARSNVERWPACDLAQGLRGSLRTASPRSSRNLCAAKARQTPPESLCSLRSLAANKRELEFHLFSRERTQGAQRRSPETWMLRVSLASQEPPIWHRRVLGAVVALPSYFVAEQPCLHRKAAMGRAIFRLVHGVEAFHL